MKKFDMPWRPAYEFWSTAGWIGAALLMIIMAFGSDMPKAPMVYMVVASVGFAVFTGRETWQLWAFKISLAGKAFSFIAPAEIIKRMKKNRDQLWLGYGFNWTNKHTQRAIEARKMDTTEVLPPKWFMKLRGISGPGNTVGASWLHGLEPDEKDVYVPLSALEGHTLVFGTTGAGKTRLYETMIFQAIRRGDIVIIIDPKGDKELKEIARNACLKSGRKDDFFFFHPAFPSQSVRIDPLKNWNRETEPASRIAGLLPGENDNFAQFSWRVVNQIAQGLIYIEDRPNLVKLRRYIESGPDALMENVLKTFFERNVSNWQVVVGPFIEKAHSKQIPNKIAPTASPELLAYLTAYKEQIPDDMKDEVVDGLISITEHSREHMSKMITSLVPLLTMLTAGDLGKLLSPDMMDISDQRPVIDTEKIIAGSKVLYVGLDSLSDSTVGSAIASILLADLAAVAGARYNYGEIDGKKIQIFIDEAAECVNQPTIQILNKARGAGFVATLAAQTLPDFVVKLGSEPKARQMLGNCNNLIALRTKCRVTQDFIVETFGETHVQTVSRSHSTGTRSDDGGVMLTGNMSSSLGEEKTHVFPPELLGMLPNLQYMAFVAGGRLIKGRLSKLSDKANNK